MAEGARLESVYRIKNSIEGSNPSPSAKYHEFFSTLRRFSQSKFHFDFEDDSQTGTASPSLLVPLFAKNSRLGYFFNANNLLNDANEFIRSRLLLCIKFANANLAFYLNRFVANESRHPR